MATLVKDPPKKRKLMQFNDDEEESSQDFEAKPATDEINSTQEIGEEDASQSILEVKIYFVTILQIIKFFLSDTHV